MKSFIVGIALAATAATASAQDVGSPVTSGRSSFYVGPYAGYMLFGNLADYPNDDLSLSLENGLFVGAQAGFSFTPNVALLANLGYSKSKFVSKRSQVIGGGTNTTVNQNQDVGTYLYDADLQFRLPFLANRMGSTVAPFVQAGLGQIKYTYNTSSLTASTSESDTKFTYNAGVGVDLQVRPNIGLRLMAKDYITSFDFDKYYDVDNSRKSRIANNVALTAGLNFGF
jgi:opacity protein-like surface antigen